MGVTKRRFEEKQQAEGEAQDILVETGCLEKCEIHEVVFNRRGVVDFSPAYRLANARISAGKIGLPEGFSRHDYTDLIKEVAESAPGECWGHAKWAEED